MSRDKHVHPIIDILRTDKVYTKGSQVYANSGGRLASS